MNIINPQNPLHKPNVNNKTQNTSDGGRGLGAISSESLKTVQTSPNPTLAHLQATGIPGGGGDQNLNPDLELRI